VDSAWTIKCPALFTSSTSARVAAKALSHDCETILLKLSHTGHGQSFFYSFIATASLVHALPGGRTKPVEDAMTQALQRRKMTSSEAQHWGLNAAKSVVAILFEPAKSSLEDGIEFVRSVML
jgi:hypothetical protein